MKMTKWIRHGDVILEQVSGVDVSAAKHMQECVLAEGEVTGHFHRLRGNIQECIHDNQRYVTVQDQEALLSHEEHDTLTIPKGTYRVMIQREVDLMGEVRKVLD